MKQIMYNLSLYFSFLKNSLKEILIYRIDCIVGVISELIVQLVSIIFVLIAFNILKIYPDGIFIKFYYYMELQEFPLVLLLFALILCMK